MRAASRNPDRWPGIAVLTWGGGLRGGISLALTLSLPPNPWRNGLLFVCYVIVVLHHDGARVVAWG